MKLSANNAKHIKIPLSCLKITDNVRMNFDEAEIEELANSIRQNGLMNPITVRPPETDADGNKTYEVIAGGRRIRAHQWLCEHGDDFSLIECCIRTGDKWALQMIENIQRTDLTPREKENAVAKALEEGLTQTQIADKLSKPIQWVSDIVAGAKIRKIADAAGLNTEEITTKTLSQLRSIPEEKLESCLTQLIAEGGTYRAATRMMQEEKNPATTHVSTISEDLPNGLYLGVEVDKVGKRLFFKDLLPGKFFILNESTDSLIVYKLCQIDEINKDCAYFSDGTNVSVNDGASVSQQFVDGKDSHNWIYDISPETQPFPSTILRFKDDSEMSEEEFNDDEAVAVENVDFSMTKTNPEPQQAHKVDHSSVCKTKDLNPFNWYVKPSDPNAMASIIGRLPTYLLEMPSNTQICIQAGNHTATIQSVIYEPENNRLIFRAFDNEFNEELKLK